ncbi:MAG: hypothetical protein ACOC0C_00395 [Bacteroidota bacterium]
MLRNLIKTLIILFVISGCRSGNNRNEELELPLPESGQEELAVADETMEEIVSHVSSPIEMAALIKDLGVPFSKEYLATTEYVDEYVTSSKKAFGLGIFGADMGYLNMYEKNTQVVDYLSAIKTLADGINVGQFFDFPTLKRLATNSQNIDSLMYISVHSFNEMDKYLRNNQRGNLSSLMITGVWVEGLYLATQVAKTSASEKLAERIGEQKKVLQQLMIILQNYKRDKFIADLIEDLRVIETLFEDVQITIEVAEPEAVEEDGMLVIIQNETSTVHISDETLQQITQQTEEIRNKLISL